MGLVGVELGPRRIADDPQAVGDLEPSVAWERRPARSCRCRSARARALRAGTRGRPRAGSRGPRRSTRRRGRRHGRRGPGPRPGPRSPGRRSGPSTPSRSSAFAIVSELRGWSVGIRRGPDWTIVVGTPKRAKTWASSQPVGPPPSTSRLAGSSRARVASRFDQVGMCSMPSIGGTFVVDPTATTTFAAGQLVDGVLVADLDPTRADDPGGAPDRRCAGRLEGGHVARVVRILGIARAVDHVVATRGCPLPVVRRRVRRVASGRVQQGLRGDAADERAAPAEPAPVHDRDARAELASLWVAASPAGPAPTMTKSKVSIGSPGAVSLCTDGSGSRPMAHLAAASTRADQRRRRDRILRRVSVAPPHRLHKSGRRSSHRNAAGWPQVKESLQCASSDRSWAYSGSC